MTDLLTDLGGCLWWGHCGIICVVIRVIVAGGVIVALLHVCGRMDGSVGGWASGWWYKWEGNWVAYVSWLWCRFKFALATLHAKYLQHNTIHCMHTYILYTILKYSNTQLDVCCRKTITHIKQLDITSTHKKIPFKVKHFMIPWQRHWACSIRSSDTQTHK